MTNTTCMVLVVDDDESMRALLERQMGLAGYRVVTAGSGTEALAACEAELPDIVLLDALMPEIDGFQLTKMLRSSARTQSVPIIMVTVLEDHRSKLLALDAGVQEFVSKPIDRDELSLRVRNVLMLRDYGRLLAEQNRILERRVEERSRQVLESYRETITTLCRAAGYKDQETGSHIRRISYYTEDLAHSLGMNAEFCETIRYASPMHDVGKIAIPDEILRKPGTLSPAEWDIMKTHTSLGARLIESGDSPYLRMGAEIALHHHERWDGSGYPRGVKGQAIPISARIMNICDQYDALRSARPYKTALSHEAAVEIIIVGNDRTMPAHFDPDVLEAFKRSAGRFREIFDSIKDSLPKQLHRDRSHHRRCTRAYAELAVGVLGVRGDRVQRDAEAVCHLLVGAAARDQAQHVDLARRQASGLMQYRRIPAHAVLLPAGHRRSNLRSLRAV